MMEVKLKVLGGTHAGQELPVPVPKFFIGRAEDCHLRPHSDMISRHHCALVVEEAFVAIRDFGSKNGTYVNDERVTAERELRTGDRIKVGPLEFEIHFGEGLKREKRPKVQDVKEAAVRTAETAGEKGLDVSQWLSDEPPAEPDKITATDTKPGVSSHTVKPLAAEAPKLDVPPVAQEPEPKKPPGKLPPAHKPPPSRDSGSAAADVLKNFMRRR
jgi:predicted component of type VI protein secretion system